jgi:hypothetical protein
MGEERMVAASIGVSDAQKSGPTGLGGWLVLVAIGLILSIVRGLVFLAQTFPPVFQNGAWSVLTTPGSDAYHPLWAPLLIFEMAGNIGFVVAWLVLVILFFKRSRNFPRMFVLVFLLNLPFILVDAWLGSLVLKDEPMFDPDTARALAHVVASVVIWVPYMRLSKRVRNTFIA